jgi:hypothetical protein
MDKAVAIGDMEEIGYVSDLKGYKTAGCNKKRMMKLTFRMSRRPRGEAANRKRKREEIKEPALVRRHRELQSKRKQAR